MDKILVSGANGQVGKELRKIAGLFPQFQFVFLSREDLAIHHFELVRNFFKGYQPRYFINCAAYTAVDKAESEQALARLVNGEAVGVLAAVCKAYNTKLIHISSDYVFDGTASVPYTEEAIPNPQSVYGESKLMGEQEAIKYNPDCIIIRTSWVYSEFGKNFVKTMMKLMSEKNTINVVNDQSGSPTYAADLAEAILQVLSFGKWTPGIYHYSNKGVISWYDFAEAIKELTGSGCMINPVGTSQYPTPAKRPAYTVLDTTKIQKTYNVEIRDWKKSLAGCIEKMLN
jgi:dTDP-4-dehydrorhamnose reductase